MALGRPARVLIGVAAAAFLASAAAMVYLKRQSPSTAIPAGGAPGAGLEDLRLPEFTLVDQEGRTVTREALAGRVTIVSFMFTHCRFVCPMLTEQMAGLTESLADTDVRFLSISVDPEHDSPERLREYAKLHEANLGRWTFATAHGLPAPPTPGARIKAIVEEGLKFGLGDDPDPQNSIKLPDGGKMNNIIHPSWFLLIGPDVKVRGLFKSSVAEEMKRLEGEARGTDRRARG